MSVYKLEDILKLAEKIGKASDALAVILFGSYARSEYDEGSDIDLLVLFQHRQQMEAARDKILTLTSKSPLFTHVITMTLSELKRSPLLPLILREGKVLYCKKRFNLQRFAQFSPYALITYSLRSLRPKERVRIVQRLYGRKVGEHLYPGIIDQAKGFKVGRNCLLVPISKERDIVGFLEKVGASCEIRYVWIPKAKD